MRGRRNFTGLQRLSFRVLLRGPSAGVARGAFAVVGAGRDASGTEEGPRANLRGRSGIRWNGRAAFASGALPC
jgi:hypothetical protein